MSLSSDVFRPVRAVYRDHGKLAAGPRRTTELGVVTLSQRQQTLLRERSAMSAIERTRRDCASRKSSFISHQMNNLRKPEYTMEVVLRRRLSFVWLRVPGRSRAEAQSLRRCRDSSSPSWPP